MEILHRDFDAKRIRKDYASVQRIYDLWGSLTESRTLDHVFRQMDIRDGEKILEVAVGTGKLFQCIVQSNPSGHNIGIDLSPDMLNKARRRLQRATGNRNLLSASAYELPFADGMFDTLVNCYMLDLLPELDFGRVLVEFRRVLRPGGKLIVCTMAFGPAWYHRMWFHIARRFPKLMTGCRPVSLHKEIANMRFTIKSKQFLSQNTFPSEIIVATKPTA